MEMLKKMGKGLLIGTLVGCAIAMFTNYFFKDLIDLLEYQTYNMRYRWEFSEQKSAKSTGVTDEAMDDGICVIDIDDRSQAKLGMYWNWNRSAHADLINNLGQHSPAAVVYDILFYDPEDQNHAQRLEKLLLRSKEKNTGIDLSDKTRSAIINTIDYDQQFVDAVRSAGNVYLGVRMSDKKDYPEYALSQIQYKMNMAWHDSLHPTSALIFPPSIRKDPKLFYRANSKSIIDGNFPALAQAARDIGHLNMPPNEDGSIRSIPIFYGYGNNPPVYLPMSVRVMATLFGTPNDEIVFVPGKYLDIGKPFKIFKDSSGVLRYSYPQVETPQIKAIIAHGKEIADLPRGKSITITSKLTLGLDEKGNRFIDMYCGLFPAELAAVLIGADYKTIEQLTIGTEQKLAPDISIKRNSDIDWVLTAPYGDQEYWINRQDLQTLMQVSDSDYTGIERGAKKLLFYGFTIKNSREGILTSSIPVLRQETLRELSRVSYATIENMAPGMRMAFGENVRIPLQPDNFHIVTYFGPRGKPFTYYSYYDIVTNRVQGSLEGKIFIVGSTVSNMFDIVNVPHSDVFPGVEVHASLIKSFLTNTFINRLAAWEDFVILLLVGVVIGFLAYVVKPLPGSLLTMLTIFAYFLTAMTLFSSSRLWIEIARPILTIVLTYTAVMVYRFITEEKDRKFLQNTFKQYLSPDLIDIMYKQKQQPKLGGEEGVRTAFFTDIQGFSTFSEKLGSPTRLVELLNEYLTVMTDTLMAHLGTLDKYEGDAIIAFFGAPMPMEDHAHQACFTALDMQDKLGDLRKKWVSEGDKWPQIVHEMRMRIGVNTGLIVTGNMGSAMRMNYTMMGDTVNLAARLESAAKQYGVYSMLSQYTYEIVKDKFECRQLDKITVVGKSEPVIIYELMAEKGKLAPDSVTMIELYGQGLTAFYAQQWDKAIEILTQSDKLEPHRGYSKTTPSQKIISYCNEFKATPPPADWDGVIKLTDK